jgi:hypothetical protein
MTSKYSLTPSKKAVTAPDGTQFLDHLGGSVRDISRAIRTSRRHRVRPEEAGDLPRISHHYYGTVDLWRLIMAYNGIVNVHREVVAGRVLKIPEIGSIDDYLRRYKRSGGGGVVVLG